jgi:Arc/MetJ family transcription regulator
MRITIDIDDKLLQQAMRITVSSAPKAAIEAALRLLIQVHSQASICRLRGKVKWQGNLNESRFGRMPH